MTRYAPLPSVSLDPRNEAQLVQAASQKVYQASNQTLNDFSSGNPLAALLEGQAFAQGEFLFWANQLPQSILLEWIGPFLGAMRRLGTPAVAQLVVSVPPSDTSTLIAAGSAFTTDANLTGGEQYTFITTTDISIPAGNTEYKVAVYSQYVGAQYNVPAGSITGSSAINVNGLTVTNPQPAVGGSDVETYQEVQERFFTLIRRPNPVSAEDWQNFFEDFYGAGTLTSVQPNRPNQGAYNYVTDYRLPNGQVSFFVLGPNGVELNETQLQLGQNVVNFSVPVENQGHLYPFTLSQVQYNITLSVQSNGPYGTDPKDSSLSFRDVLYNVLTPGNVFPPTIDPTVSDVDAAFYASFPSTTRFNDIHIESSLAYNTPPLLEPSAATYTEVYSFEGTDSLLKQNDLVVTSLPTKVYYPVLKSFTPYSDAKPDQTIYGNLVLQQIQILVPGNYLKGQVVYWDPANGGDGQLHVIKENLTVSSSQVSYINDLISIKQVISGAKSYSPWVVGNTYQATTGGGVYDPDIVQYDYGTINTFNVDVNGLFVPPGAVPLATRPGALIWVVNNNFTLQPSTNNITGAQTAFEIGSPIVPQVLTVGTTYSAGTWVYTPQIGSGPNPVADPYYNYVDIQNGVVNKYAYVVSTFTYTLPTTTTVSVYFDSLVTQGILREIVVENADNGLPVCKYKPRFPANTYLLYRPDAVTEGNQSYYAAASYFTPNSTVAQDLINEGLIVPLYLTPEQKTAFLRALSDPASGLNTPTRMFRFFKGDQTFFRRGQSVIAYTATTNVHPLFAFYVYLQNGSFVETAKYTQVEFVSLNYIPYFDPGYARYSEDTLLSVDGKNLYRTMKAFTPSLTVVDWTNTTVVNTARIQEYAGNLLRYVDEYVCEEPILSQLGQSISAIKLGVAQVTLVPKDKGRFPNSLQQLEYVWENAQSATEVPQLSWYTGTSYQYSPPDYRNGTMNL